MNTVIMSGRISKMSELYKGERGSCVFVDIASDRTYVDKNSNRQKTDFVPVRVYGNKAEALIKHKKVGDWIEIKGRINFDVEKKEDGTYKRETYLVADTIEYGAFTGKSETIGDYVSEDFETRVSEEEHNSGF